MNLAAILGFCLISLGSLSLGWLPSHARGATVAAAVPTPQSQGDATPAQAPAVQSPESTKASPSPAGQTPASAVQTKPSPTPHRSRKKATPNCSNAPTPLNPSPGKPAGSMKADSTSTDSAAAGSPALKPCPPPKKVVRNGGSDQPAVQLTGGTTAEQASHKRASTEQLTAATVENLKKAEGLQLDASQQEMVSQIKQFMAQSKAAVAAGDLETGHNLAMKAHLLSDELVKP
jgi:hypothetical protein